MTIRLVLLNQVTYTFQTFSHILTISVKCEPHATLCMQVVDGTENLNGFSLLFKVCIVFKLVFTKKS